MVVKLTGRVTCKCPTLEEYNVAVANLNANVQTDIYTLDEANLTISFDLV